MRFQETLAFDDVLLVPQFSDIESRKEIDLSSKLGDIKLDIPIIASPMDTVTGAEMAIAVAHMGGLGIIHRYNTPVQQMELVERAILFGSENVGAAIGVTGDYLERADILTTVGLKLFCIDVAHGDHISVKNAIRELRARYGKNIHIMAGNVATLEGFNHVAHWGADSVRVGIGGGCFTPDTLINTENGLKKIQDIRVGDNVYTHDGSLQPVINTMIFNRDEEILSINDIKCTKNHEFYVIDKINEHLVTEENIHTYARWVQASDLDKECHLLIELE
jgi:IMP dehydrogenase/GMP reductase